MLPRRSITKKPKPKRKSKGWAGLQAKDLEGIEQKIRDKFKWKHSPRNFQLEAIKAQVLRQDVLVHAGTGAGKSMIAAGPHALTDSAKKMVTFVVSPLIALQEEQAQTFRDEFGLSATAINSAHEGCTSEIMEKICDGEWQIVLISPEIILSPKFRDHVLLNQKMIPRILSVVVDEAHVISHWGAEFRKDYGRLGILRSILPVGTPFVAMSATLSRHIRRDVLRKLEFNDKTYLSLDIGNDRTNVSIVVRSIHNAMNTYSDMDFVIPQGITQATEIPLTFIYADKISDGVGIEDRLTELLPENLRDQGLIRPYSAAFTVKHRAEVMKLFRAGVIRVLICTDAAGMGCNIPNIDVVVQWRLPTSVSGFVQRAGRAARDPTRTGLAVLLVEKSVFDADLSKISNEKNTTAATKQKGVRQSKVYPKAPKGYAIRHGIQRGAHHGHSDENQVRNNVPLDSLSPDEGLYSLAQTGECRRGILSQIYGNKPSELSVPCCDICAPTLLNRTRPSPPDVAPRKTAVKMGALNTNVKIALQDWRRNIWKRDFINSMFGPSVILKDETVEILASVGPITRLNELEKVTGEDWPWFGTYGDELLDAMKRLDIGPMQAKPPQKRAEKRAAPTDGDTESNEGDGGRKKRAVTLPISISTLTAVNCDIVETPQAPSQHRPFSYMPYFNPYTQMQSIPSTTQHHPSSSSSHSNPTPIPYNPYSYHPTPYPQYIYSPYPQYPMHPYSYQSTPSRNPNPSAPHRSSSSQQNSTSDMPPNQPN